jgi:hypothetical protein
MKMCQRVSVQGMESSSLIAVLRLFNRIYLLKDQGNLALLSLVVIVMIGKVLAPVSS